MFKTIIIDDCISLCFALAIQLGRAFQCLVLSCFELCEIGNRGLKILQHCICDIDIYA